MKKKLPKILVICGQTATGKSDLAVHLARTFDGEVISADSRQVYKGLDIGSGKITTTEMKGVTHYLLDIADPKKARYTVEDFRRDANVAVSNVLSKGKLPIVCGGTGFYIDTLALGTKFPEVPPNKKLRERLSKKTTDALMEEISKLDPRRAKTLDQHNKVRIIRAIEVAKALGRVPTIHKKHSYDILWIGLSLDRAHLEEKVHRRLLKRIKAGMIQEVEKLHKKGVSWKRLYDFGLEYRFVALYLRKKINKEEMTSRLEQEILNYAKRQVQWFKRNKSITWFDPKDTSKIVRAVKRFT